MSLRSGWLRFIKHTINPLALRAARRGRGPFSLVQHVGRKTGTPYESPLILAEVAGGFVAELTYGENVAWYRNAIAAGGRCVIRRGSQTFAIDRIEPLDAATGLAALGPPQNLVLRLLRRTEFRLLHVAGR